MEDKIITIDLIEKAYLTNDLEALKDYNKLSPLVDSLSKTIGLINKSEYLNILFSDISFNFFNYKFLFECAVTCTYHLYKYLSSRKKLSDNDIVTFEEVCNYLEADLYKENKIIEL